MKIKNWIQNYKERKFAKEFKEFLKRYPVKYWKPKQDIKRKHNEI